MRFILNSVQLCTRSFPRAVSCVNVCCPSFFFSQNVRHINSTVSKIGQAEHPTWFTLHKQTRMCILIIRSQKIYIGDKAFKNRSLQKQSCTTISIIHQNTFRVSKLNPKPIDVKSCRKLLQCLISSTIHRASCGWWLWGLQTHNKTGIKDSATPPRYSINISFTDYSELYPVIYLGNKSHIM